MMDKKIAIIGGGLSGLYAAYLLEQQGITDYLLLEARDNFGGRIQSFTPNNTEASFDLGPAWFWPDIQPEFAQLINDFQLDSFAQYDTGNMLVERSLSKTPNEISGFVTEPTSMRLTQGMSGLIKTISEKLTNTDIHCSNQVTKLERHENKVIIHYHDSQNNTQQMATSDHVLLALPPRLAIKLIEFTPSLPETLIQQWQNTATWMAPQAKYIAVYEHPFWREQQLSGSVRSMVGPMVEIHDASLSTEPKHAALFGFIGIPAQQRKDIGEEQIKAYCQQQLVRLFGEQAAQPVAHMIKDWAQDTFTATTLDSQELSHNLAPPRSPINSTWSQHLTGIGSEWATEFPGYLAGATEAAELGVERYMALYEK